jgi:GxxExxY protein
MTENEIAAVVVDCAFKTHSRLGPGLFESVYESVMDFELKKRGMMVEVQRGIPVVAVFPSCTRIFVLSQDFGRT